MPAGGKTLYILSGGGDRSDWVKNLLNDPVVSVRLGTKIVKGRGRIVTGQEEDRLARKLVVAKYYRRDELNLTGWEAEVLTGSDRLGNVKRRSGGTADAPASKAGGGSPMWVRIPPSALSNIR